MRFLGWHRGWVNQYPCPENRSGLGAGSGVESKATRRRKARRPFEEAEGLVNAAIGVRDKLNSDRFSGQGY
jgi:hypothetical protein